MLSLRDFRTGPKGLADLLNYSIFVDEGVILNKDGSFTCGYFFRGEDFGASTLEQMAELSRKANGALVKLGTGWMLHVDSIRIPALEYPAEDRSYFTDACTLAIDAERREQYRRFGTHFDNIYAMTITYLTPTEMSSKIAAVFIDDKSGQKKGVDYSQILERFKSQVRDIEDALSVSLKMRAMNTQELLTFIHSCITGKTHTVKAPNPPVYLDYVLGCDHFQTGLAPKIGDKYLKMVAINMYPGETIPGILEVLNRLPFEYRFSTRFIALDSVEAEKKLQKERLHWWQKRHGLAGLVKQAFGGGEQTFQNTDAVLMASDADAAITNNSGGNVKFGYYTIAIIVSHEDINEADQRAREVVKIINAIGYAAFIETINAVECYLGSLPGHGYQNVRRPLVHTMNVADMLPLAAAWAGHETNPNPFLPPNSPPLLYAETGGSTPFRMSLHVGDLGHFMLIGPPGAGKSTALNLLLAQHMRYPNAQVIGFDFGYSMYTLCEAAGGSHYDIGAEKTAGMNTVGFCPLGEIDTASDRAWAAEYVELLVTLRMNDNDAGLSLDQRNEIREAIDLLAKGTENNENKMMVRTLTHFCGTIQDRVIKSALEHYQIGKSALGDIIDAEKDALIQSKTNSRFFVFEMGQLFNMDSSAPLPVMLYLFHQIEKRVSRSIPTLIAIDEAFRSFAHPLAIQRLVKWLEVMRKENAAVGFATQNIDTVLSSPVGSSLVQTTPTKILLPNSVALTPKVSKLYQDGLGLNEREVTLIGQARKKRDYYCVFGSDGRRMINLNLGPLTLAFVGANGKDVTKKVRQFKSSFGDDWVAHFLKDNGVSDGWIDWFRKKQKELA